MTGTRTVLDGNAFYEIDEACMEEKERRKETEGEGGQEKASGSKKKT